jgi:outer membrane murein-binding lipoprotein Lpp
MNLRLHVVLTLAVALAAAVLVAAGCGSDDKPEYCSNVSDLQQSVDDLKSVQLERGALSTLQTDVQKVQSNANAVVSSAKQDFPSETSALESSVSSLSTSIEQLPPDPTTQQLRSLRPQIRNVVTATQGVEDATSSACD